MSDRGIPPRRRADFAEKTIERVNMFAPARIIRRIDEWRRLQPEIPCLSEAARRVLEAGIEALEGHHDQALDANMSDKPKARKEIGLKAKK